MNTASFALPFRPEVPSSYVTSSVSLPPPAPGPVPGEWAALGSRLAPYLQEIPDPRGRHGRRYALPWLLELCLLGLCCGCQGYLSVARWARSLRPEVRRELGWPAGPTPCAATLLNLFRRLDWDAFAQQLHRWVETGTATPAASVASERPVAEAAWQGFALDGKTLRGSLAAGAEVAHVVSLVTHGLGISVLEAGVAAKQGELTVAPAVLAPVLGPGRVITGDALFTQRRLCEQIRAGGSHYVFPVKENQPTLLAEVQAVLAPVTRREAQEQHRRSTGTVNEGHGRTEHRFLLLAAVDPETVHWPGVAQVFLLERRRRHPARGDHPARESREIVYGITSLDRGEAGPETVLRLQRGHWSVENQVHYVLDTFFREDERRLQEGKIARGMAALRRGALNLLRRLGGRSIPEASDRAKANPALLTPLLGSSTDN
jgi:predicted transposase YbfD/YdcC